MRNFIFCTPPLIIIIIIIIIIIMSIVPLGTYVVYKSSPTFSVPGDKPEITPAVLPTFIQIQILLRRSNQGKCGGRHMWHAWKRRGMCTRF
jgi:hypothetical protein